MNYSQSGTRRGKPRRSLDPSVSFSSPTMSTPQNPYLQHPYNQQMPSNNGLPPDYGFNVPDQAVPTSNSQYGFNTKVPVQNYPGDSQQAEFSTPQFATQLFAQPVVTNMAVQYGNALVGSGKQQIEKYVPLTALKYYFAVDTDYVIAKLMLLIFPFTHKDWSVKYEQEDVPLQPRYEKNAPDMYIPSMAFLTYVVLAGLVLGVHERFTPEQISIVASSALAWYLIEVVIHTVSLYIMNLDTSLATLDLVAYCGYKYVGINATLLFSLAFKKTGYYAILVYFSISLAFFLVRSLKLKVIPRGHRGYTEVGNRRRHYFILYLTGLQPVLMWWLSYYLM